MAIKKPTKKPTCCVSPLVGAVASASLPYLLTLGPSLPLESKNEALIRYKLHQAKIAVTAAAKNAKDNLDFIVQEIENIKMEIQNVRLAMKELDESNTHQASFEAVNPKLISDACKLKSSLQGDLSDLLHEESFLRRQLCLARIAYRNAKLDVVVLNEDMKKYRDVMLKGIPLFMQWHKKETQTKYRLKRELRVKKNAVLAREETITSVANSITDHVLQKIPGSHNKLTRQLQEARSARLSISNHLKATFRKARERKALALTEIQLKQQRQMKNLAKLKKDIMEIKETLSAKNQLKRIHAEEIAVEKHEVKNLLQAQGANPYLAEYLLAIEEKQREIQRKMLVEEQKRLLEMQREYAKIEASKAKEESEKKKWDEFWSQKKKTKIENDKKASLSRYFDLSGEDSEEEEIEKSVSDKVEAEEESHHTHENSSQENETSEEQEYEYSETKPEVEKHRESFSSKRMSKSRDSKDSSKQPPTKIVEAPRTASPTTPPPQQTQSVLLQQPSTRRTMHLDYAQKDKLMRKAGENTRAVLLSGRNRNLYDFGEVPVGGKKYITVTVANIGFETVKLKMSLLNPYGPFTFCNSLRDIPTDNFFALKFKFEPTEEEEYKETVKIEEDIGKSDSFIIIKLKGHSILSHSLNE